MISKDDMVWFQIVEETSTNKLTNGDIRKAWDKLSKIFKQTIGASNTIIWKKSKNRELGDIKRDLEDWVNDMELFRGDLKILNVKIYDT